VIVSDGSSSESAPTPLARSNLWMRVIAALVLVPAALLTAYLGGWIYALFWTAAAAAVLYEWTKLVGGRDSWISITAGLLGLIAALLLGLYLERIGVAILLIGLGGLGAAIFAPGARRAWVFAGVLYAGALLLGTLLLRADPVLGFMAMVLLFAVVWATDIAGYFVGRALGGPKLAPRISPGKTWSGAIGGTVFAVLAALGVAVLAGLPRIVPVMVIAVALSVAAQAGDLMESAIKRHFNAKDAGTLIPGHGGVMDRLDGFWAALLLAACIGMVRGGVDDIGQGLLLW
jgi:phosphatidate cytidylyltransferase